MDAAVADAIEDGYLKTCQSLRRLQLAVHDTFSRLENVKARDYCNQGLGRRIHYIGSCLAVFQKAFEFERDGHDVPDELRTEETVNLNQFLSCLTGGMDNLAWIFVYEWNIAIHRNDTTLWARRMQKHIPKDLREILSKHKDWNETHLASFRDASAHRIMPYVVPHIVSNGTKIWESHYIQDFEDGKLVLLHPQAINDFGVFDEIITAGLRHFQPKTECP
jgi:hypothetical protein